MIRFAVVGDIGSGKSFISNLFNYPVFNADLEVADIYKKNKSCFLKIKKKINVFLKKNKNKKLVVLDIPLYFENKLNKKNDIIIFIDAEKKQILKQLKKKKKKKSNFIIKNDYKIKTAKNNIKKILKKVK